MKKKIILIIIAVIVVIAVILGVSSNMNGAPLASPYTKVALRKDFSTVFNEHIQPNNQITPLGIVSAMGMTGGNLVLYMYYACEDYQQGHINQKQFNQVMTNLKPSVDYLTNLYNTNISIVKKNDTIKMENLGMSYVETHTDGTWSGDTVNYINIQQMMFDTLSQMYQTQDPSKIYNLALQYGVYLERASFYYSENDQYGLNMINSDTFKLDWLISNLQYTPDAVQKLFQ